MTTTNRETVENGAQNRPRTPADDLPSVMGRPEHPIDVLARLRAEFHMTAELAYLTATCWRAGYEFEMPPPFGSATCEALLAHADALDAAAKEIERWHELHPNR